MNLQCPRCKTLLMFSTQEAETSHGKVVRYNIYRCDACGYQERRGLRDGATNEVRVIKFPREYHIESKDKNGKFRMTSGAYEFTTMCHSLGVMFGEIPDTAAVTVSQACLPDVSSDRDREVQMRPKKERICDRNGV